MSATCAYENCGRPVHNNGTECIFHAAEKDPQEFRNALAKQILKWRNEKAEKWNFRGWVFVDVKRGGIYELQPYRLFIAAVFPVEVDFANATFMEDGRFSNAIFRGYATFQNTTFRGNAEFSCATFKKDADFLNARFAWANFFGATFERNTFFTGATFAKDAIFGSAAFTGDADFSYATFSRALVLSFATFGVIGSFVNIHIAGDVRLTWPGEGRKLRPGRLLLENVQFPVLESGERGTLDLRDNALREDSPLVIKNTDMSRILLTGVDCSLIDFYAVTWGRYRRRPVCGDELLLRLHPAEAVRLHVEWAGIARIYELLIDRLLADRNAAEAKAFETGLSEIWRLRARETKHIGSYIRLTFFKAVSNYGHSLARPCAWFLLSIGLFAVGYFYTSSSPSIDPWENALKASIQIASLNWDGLEVAKESGYIVDFLIMAQRILSILIGYHLLWIMKRLTVPLDRK